MVTEAQYEEAIQMKDEAERVIAAYHREKRQAFETRMKENPVFTDDELFYSRGARCPCGAGLAYPKGCGPWHYWDCSAILKGKEDKTVKHTDQLPFSFYDIKGENETETTRPKQENNNPA